MADRRFRADMKVRVTAPANKDFTHCNQMEQDIVRILREHGYKVSDMDSTYVMPTLPTKRGELK